MPTFSANLGFLWTELVLPDAIRAAHAAGFDAVECHWPYDTPPSEVIRALGETGLPMLGLNTARGNVAAGDFGLAALPDRRDQARASIDQALEYAQAIECGAVHVMAGCASGARAGLSFAANLEYAAQRAALYDITILIEPLNGVDVPDYFLKTNAQARGFIDELNMPNIRLMFDCYHVGMRGESVAEQLDEYWPHIGHVQFASVPTRGAPFQGRIEYREVFALLGRLGYKRPLGAEYRPDGATEMGLGWLSDAKSVT